MRPPLRDPAKGRPGGQNRRVSIIKINAITVPAEAGDELAMRFAKRLGAVDNQEGFEGFELLKPSDGRTQWLVVTRWRDEEAFGAWVSSAAFQHGHQGANAPAQHGGPVSTASELWHYEIAVSSPGSAG
jgi:heme oxygenase (mycobilin-producing)